MNWSNDLALLLGRLAMAALFLPDAIGKATNFKPFVASLADKGLPFPMFGAAAAVAVLLLGSIALILGIYPKITALFLIAFVIVATATTHLYWNFPDPARRMQEINFFKNVGLIGGLLVYMASGAGSWALRNGNRAATAN